MDFLKQPTWWRSLLVLLIAGTVTIGLVCTPQFTSTSNAATASGCSWAADSAVMCDEGTAASSHTLLSNVALPQSGLTILLLLAGVFVLGGALAARDVFYTRFTFPLVQLYSPARTSHIFIPHPLKLAFSRGIIHPQIYN